MKVSAQATVRRWDDEEGWGVLDSDATPGGCWTHFAALDVDGYRTLSPGQRVLLEAESPGQDGYAWRALRVVIDGAGPTTPHESNASGAYTSDLSVTFDDDA